jgi:DNA-3-methyladenine glycosylase
VTPDRDGAAAVALAAPVEQAAQWLLGRRVVHGHVVLRVTEVEAYADHGDPASHAWHGRTDRNSVMFGPAGHAYVYRSYGVHWCLNIVAGPDRSAAAVLLRAGQIVGGISTAANRRPAASGEHELARGPGRLTQALGVDARHQGVDMLDARSALRLLHPAGDAASGGPPPEGVACGPRVGVSRAANVAWRYWLRGDPSVSTYRRSPRAPKEACSGEGDCCHEHRSPG